MCITFLGRTQKLSLFPELESWNRSWIWKILVSSQNHSLYTTQKSQFFQQIKCFLLASRQNFIHKIVVSDFWKCIKSIDVWSQNSGTSIGFLQGKYFQIWNSDLRYHNLAAFFSEIWATLPALLDRIPLIFDFFQECSTIRAHRRIL